MLHHKNMPIKFWAKATHCATYILHKTSSETLNEKTLFKTWTSIKPYITHMKIWKCLLCPCSSRLAHNKLNSKNKLGGESTLRCNNFRHIWKSIIAKINTTKAM